MADSPTNSVRSIDTIFPPLGQTTEHTLKLPGQTLDYRAMADWMTLRKLHKPVAHMFYTAYLADTKDTGRPLTFVFNGGPGAASAYLHMGALGPQRLMFDPQGRLPAPPTRLIDNAESWLTFTDLVFIDPIGTGFSRAIKGGSGSAEAPAGSGGSSNGQPPPAAVKPGSPDDDPHEDPVFWEVDRDLDSLGEFITRFLSQQHRWMSPVFIAGESYGGFRVAKMARRLQEGHGVGLSGAVLISPAFEFDALLGSDYDLIYWTDLFPSLALSAHYHGRTCGLHRDMPMEELRRQAEAFAQNDLLRWLVQGTSLPPDEQSRIASVMASLCGLPEDVVQQSGGRITATRFCRELLREARQLCGHYDATITTTDPFPDRHDYAGPDPTLFSLDRLFTSAINHHLRSNLQVATDLDYRLLSMDVNKAWKDDSAQGVFRRLIGAVDDLRYGMSLNEHMRVFICHGYYDLVTPYFSSQRILQLMKLTAAQQERVLHENYGGGHMFYSWEESRTAFHRTATRFVTGGSRE